VWRSDIIRNIRNIAEGSEVTRPWRILNILQFSGKGSSSVMRGDRAAPRARDMKAQPAAAGWVSVVVNCESPGDDTTACARHHRKCVSKLVICRHATCHDFEPGALRFQYQGPD
jgi:hypothetical protein